MLKASRQTAAVKNLWLCWLLGFFCSCFYVGSSTHTFLLSTSQVKLWKDPDPFVAGTDFLCVPITCIWNDLQHSKKPIGVGVSCRESYWDKWRVSRLEVSQFRHFCTVASEYHILQFTPEMAAHSVKHPQILVSCVNCRVNVLAFIMVELMLHMHWGSRIRCPPYYFSTKEDL